MDNLYKDKTDEFNSAFNAILTVLDKMNSNPEDKGYFNNIFQSVLFLCF